MVQNPWVAQGVWVTQALVVVPGPGVARGHLLAATPHPVDPSWRRAGPSQRRVDPIVGLARLYPIRTHPLQAVAVALVPVAEMVAAGVDETVESQVAGVVVQPVVDTAPAAMVFGMVVGQGNGPWAVVVVQPVGSLVMPVVA